MYFTTTISVALVLFLVGLESMLFLSAHELMRHVKESMVLSIVMTENANDEDVARMERLLDVVPYSLDYQYISREQALQYHIENLGENPQDFFRQRLFLLPHRKDAHQEIISQIEHHHG